MAIDLGDPALRVGAMAKLSHAFEMLRSLQNDMTAWWEQEPCTLELRLLDDRRTLELRMQTDPLPLTNDWHHRAADILHNLRLALNRVTYAVAQVHMAPKKPADSNFPIHKGEEGWVGWLKKHPELPPRVVARFREFEPFVSGRPMLTALTRADNLDKHEDGFGFAFTVTEARFDFETEVDGRWEEDSFGDQVELAAGESTDLEYKSQLLGTIRLPAEVQVLSPSGDLDASGWAVTPMLRFDDQEIPLLDAFNRIGHEVAWAISYVLGLVESSDEPPVHFDF